MILRKSGEEAFSEELGCFQLGSWHRERDNGHVNAALVQSVKDNGRDLFDHSDIYELMLQ